VRSACRVDVTAIFLTHNTAPYPAPNATHHPHPRARPSTLPIPSLQAVLDIVVSHQGLPLKTELVKRILSTLVLPSPVPYRSLLRRFAALSSKSCAEVRGPVPTGSPRCEAALLHPLSARSPDHGCLTEATWPILP
jgi:hypothetical protein